MPLERWGFIAATLALSAALTSCSDSSDPSKSPDTAEDASSATLGSTWGTTGGASGATEGTALSTTTTTATSGTPTTGTGGTTANSGGTATGAGGMGGAAGVTLTGGADTGATSAGTTGGAGGATSATTAASANTTGQNPSGPPLAFPGAEGFGREASGGRLGEVVHVTNLDDAGAGSFRDAVGTPNRIVVFDVGGVINITSRIVVHSNITIAGQSAPGGGITVYGNGLAFNGDSGGGNVIVRYLRVRMGKNGDSGKDAVSISAGENYMFDHVSISWGRDGTLDVNGTPIDRLSFQECIIAQGINDTNHSTGGLLQPSGVDGRWSMIRSLYIDNKTRNPKARGKHEFINSVLYNWAEHGYIMGDTTNGTSESNLIGNYFIYGPSSNADTHITGTTEYFHVYPEDNWVDSNKNGVLDGSLLTDFKTASVQSSAYDYPGVANVLSAEAALSHVIDNAGASLVRDAVDEMLIEQLGSYGTEGAIIDTEDDNGIPGNVGTVAAGEAPADADRDGMPDAWELSRGLDPSSMDDPGDDDADGYTNIEEYLSCIVGEGDC